MTYGNRGALLFTYEEGRLARIMDSAGRSIVFTGNREGRITSIAVPDPAGRAITFAHYEYDPGGHLIAAADADGARWRYHYDDDRRLIDMRMPTDLTFHYRYDRKGRCVETWGDYPGGVADRTLAPNLSPLMADGRSRVRGLHHTKLDYGKDYTEVVDTERIQRFFGRPDGTITKAVDGTGGVTTRTMDVAGNEIEREDPGGAVTRWTYDGKGERTSETDAMGRTTSVVRDVLGRVIETTDPAGGKIVTSRNTFGDLLMQQDQRGGLATYQYDGRGRCLEEISAGEAGRSTSGTARATASRGPCRRGPGSSSSSTTGDGVSERSCRTVASCALRGRIWAACCESTTRSDAPFATSTTASATASR